MTATCRPRASGRTGLALCAAAAVWAAATPAQEVALTVTGGHEGLRDAVAANALTLTLTPGETPPAEWIAAARADYRRILTALYAEGYYGGAISVRVDGQEAAGIAPLDAPGRIDAIAIDVAAGPRFTFGAVSAAPLAPRTVLPGRFAAGATAESGQIAAAATAAIDGWRQAGHPLAAVAGQEIRAIHADARLDAGLRLDPGPALTFGPLAVTGNVAVRADRIVEIAGLPTGRPYDPDDVALATLRLRRTGAFESVALVEGDRPGPGDTLPVTAQVAEMAPRRLGFGAEVATDDGLTLTAFWLHRNLLGGAERFRIGAEVTGIEGASGGPDAEVELTFGRPATFNADTDLTATLALSHLDEADFTLDQATGDLSLVKYVRSDLTYRAGVGFITAREETPYRIRNYTLVTAPLAATLDRRDDPFDADSGYFIDIALTPFLGVAGGDSGGRAYADLRYYRSFGEGDRLTLAVRGQAGSVWGADLLAAPADFLFYSGGGGTVRGQPYQSLGIGISRDFGGGAESIRRGGRAFLGAQIEARFDVTRAIGLVGFYDFGAIDIDSLVDSGSDWHAGAGLGLRYDTAIGPIRLDLATPASGDDAGRSLQVYIGIGQAF